MEKISKKNKLKIAEENILRESDEKNIEKLKSIRGFDFNKLFNFGDFIKSYETTGIQASNLYKAIKIIKDMKKSGAFIYLGYTSNLVTSGLRDIFCYLAKYNLIDVIVTTAGGVEEDIIKCLGDFKLGSFNMEGKKLRKEGINRAGNIFIPNSRYCRFEEFILPILEEHKKDILTPSKLINLLGKEINNKDSIYYWCYKNKIPVFCPALTDGSLGDMIYFFKSKNPDFKIDISDDIVNLNNSTIGKEKTGIILLGSGIIKHHICNANMFRNGADYAVYINTQPEFNGSDSGARPDEAVSWGKITSNANTIKVYADASLVFPLIVAAGAFEKDSDLNI
ncbi:MAG: deoxyhypusine synthase [Candidatus Nanoarchaeia archaeon]